ncbi:hypothetical protein BV22DRAFT_977254, partial [Leucogyrophana mollusca]
FFLVEKEKLQLTVGGSQNCIVQDTELGEIVCVVLRDFVQDEAVLHWLYAVLEELGTIPLIGFSAGSRNAPKFNLAKNFWLKSLHPSVLERID